MIRPCLAPATSAFLVLGFAAGAEAAGPFSALLAQSAAMNDLRGPGMYLNLFKFVPVLLIFLLWAWTTHWVQDDTKELGNVRFEMWNSTVFFSGVIGFLLVFTIPVYVIGLLLLLIAYLAPTLTYVYSRNQTVNDDEKVLTPYHFGEVLNGLLGRKLFNREASEHIEGPPINLIAKTPDGKFDGERTQKGEESEYALSTKDLVYDAILRRASDIYLDPTKEELAVRYRIDGRMHAAEPFDRPTGDAVLNLLKLVGGLDPAEKRKPQEGLFSARFEGREIDLRVATSGSKAGEKMVVRILDAAAQITKLDEVGIRPKMATALRELIAQPRGLILFAGPSGSGKTATLYACLREIDRYQRNIITLEDPVEYQIDNVSQIEFDRRGQEPFGEVLRSAVRQDPDVLMIHEIRDQDTAAMACQATAGGRLVVSTITADDAVSALFRFLDLGIEPATLSSNLSAVLAQRLVRLLCETCKEPYKPKAEFLKKANLPAEKVDVFYRPPKEPEQICPVCGGTGYMGRTGIFELLIVTDAMRDQIRDNPTAKAVKDEARKNGMIYLSEDGLRQVIQGRTSIEELMQAVK